MSIDIGIFRLRTGFSVLPTSGYRGLGPMPGIYELLLAKRPSMWKVFVHECVYKCYSIKADYISWLIKKK